jgi:hypothetical protein
VKFIDVTKQQTVTIELSPADCFLLAEACEASIRFDQARDITLAEAFAAALTAAGMAASADFYGATDRDWSLAAVRAGWLPKDDSVKPQD